MPNPATKHHPAELWPTCPQCGSRRSAQCPVCHTVGEDFESAEADFGQLLGLPVNDKAAPSCGSCGCSSLHLVEEKEDKQDSEPAKEQSEDLGDEGEPRSPAAGMVLCRTCDEPFTPKYLRRCGDCGHEFSDGVDSPLAEEPMEPINPRLIVCIVVLLGLAIGGGLYFTLLF